MGKRVGPAAERVAARSVAGPGGCFLWTGARNNGGYGVIQTNRVQQYVHRVAYEAWVGPIPEGLAIDHLCHVRNCVNVAHLEPTTPAVNSSRMIRVLANVCFSGRHEFTPENTQIGSKSERLCRACKSERNARSYLRWKARQKAVRTA